MKTVKAVAPYRHPGFLNYKMSAYEAWERTGGKISPAHYPPRWLHGLAFRYELPDWCKSVNCQFLRSCWCSGEQARSSIVNSHNEARLRFVEPVSLYFDTFPDYALYEVIPFVWDCWPCYEEKMCKWLEKHKVKTAIFTSSQTADKIRERFPQMNVMYCPEAVDVSCYTEGKLLKERSIDLLEFGRSNEKVFRAALPDSLNHVCTMQNGMYIYTNEQLYNVMGDAKVTITLPRSYTQPEIAGDIETLTQRYWECMLSRMVMLGHAPKELVDLIGYNPVVELDVEHTAEQVQEILAHIEDYQPLVDKNRETAIRMGDWTVRMREVMKWLKGCGYEI